MLGASRNPQDDGRKSTHIASAEGIGIMENTMETTILGHMSHIMENQMEKKMDNYMSHCLNS